ncbi:MAG: hypothetical protein KGI98_11490 [Euryarchaeota archaeon]|nr:hypothetical protein [Euryarchaeota archaeon]
MFAIPASTFDLSRLGPERRHLRGPGWAEQLSIDGTSITVRYSPSSTRTLRWDDPELAFMVTDFRNPVARAAHFVPKQAHETPFTFWPFSTDLLTVTPDRWIWLPTEAAESIVNGASLAKLIIYELPVPSSALDDLQRAVFRRTPIRHSLLEKLGIYLPPPGEDA